MAEAVDHESRWMMGACETNNTQFLVKTREEVHTRKKPHKLIEESFSTVRLRSSIKMVCAGKKQMEISSCIVFMPPMMM